MPVRRQRIARSFGAASGYDANSRVQRHVAERLAETIASSAPPRDATVLEIGCGTGHLSEALSQAFPDALALFTDLSPEMTARCRARLGPRPNILFAAVDGETGAFARGAFDLVASSMAFQWFEDLETSLAALAATLKPGGLLAFATLGVDTFHEWQTAHRRLGLDSGIMDCPTLAALDALLARAVDAGGRRSIEEERLAMTYPDARAFLREVKAVGAGVPRPQHQPLTSMQLKTAMRALETSAEGPVQITWHILYATVRMKGLS